MRLHRLVRGSINAVNHDKQILWYASQGSINNRVTGISIPTFAPVQTIWAQIQPVPTDQLAHLENLNIQGVLRKVYMRGAVATAVRPNGTGGDLLQFPERWTPAIQAAAAEWSADSQVTADSSRYTASGISSPIPGFKTWLVVLVPEQWESWCHVIVRLQNDINSAWTADSESTADSSERSDA